MESTKVPSMKGTVKVFVGSVIPEIQKIISPLAITHPQLYTALSVSAGLYGYYMALNQEALNEYIEFLMSHPDKFRKEIIASKEFRQGFVLNLQDYIKARTQQRRELIKSIFLGFTEDVDKDNFSLEQLDEIATKISPEAVKTLSLIDSEILPLKEKTIREELKKKNIGTERSEEWWYEQDFERASIWTFMDKWLYERYSPNSEMVKKRYGITDKWDSEKQNEAWDVEREERRKINLVIEELVDLGIFKIRLSEATFDGGNAILYDITKLGYQFLKYIKDI